MNPSRRDFLRFAVAFGLGPTIAAYGRDSFSHYHPFAGQAAGVASEYKALVCIFLFGGNDTSNFVLPTDADSWGRYQTARTTGPSPIALAPPGAPVTPGALPTMGGSALGGVLPILPRTVQPWPDGTKGTGVRTFAFHPQLTNLQQLFTQGRVAIIANVGTLLEPITKKQYLDNAAAIPAYLFSHQDQQASWQCNGAGLGWGGLLGDFLAPSNAQAVFTAISLFGNAALLAGKTIHGYQAQGKGALPINGLGGPSLFGSTAAPSILKDVVTKASVATPIQTAYASVVSRSIASLGILNSALQKVVPLPEPPMYINPFTGEATVNALAAELQGVANLIAVGPNLGMSRQVFFVGLPGFDLHQNMNQGHPALMAELDGALGYFYQILGNLGGKDMTSQVTAFTLSEFGRAFISNGSGTDHGWGGSQIVMGGAVKGGDIYGTYPTVGVDLAGIENPGALPGNGAWIPTISVDQYAATLGGWLGLTDAQLLSVFPNLPRFTAGGPINLGFL